MSLPSISVPVVFFIFNRPDQTRRVFETISEARPECLLIIADGPRPLEPEDTSLVEETRAIVEKVDWPCRVLRNFSDVNLGNFDRLNSGIDWAFEQVSEAIILEDDCLPHASFFLYCQDLLERYQNDERVFSIRGTELSTQRALTPYSYYFSKHFNPWGWATWKRAWKLHDPEMKWYEEIADISEFDSVWTDLPGESSYFSQIVESQFRGLGPKHWDYRVQFTVWSQSRLVIAPQVNLVKNIGFGPTATNLKHEKDSRSDLRTQAIGSLIHPPVVVRNLTADTYKFRADLQLGYDCSSDDNAATSRQKLEDRLVELETQMETKEFVIQQQHRDLMRLQGLDP